MQPRGRLSPGVTPFNPYDACVRAYSKTFTALTKRSGFYLKGAKAATKRSASKVCRFIFEGI